MRRLALHIYIIQSSDINVKAKIALHLKKVCYKTFCVNTVSENVVRHSWPIYPCTNGSPGPPLLRENLAETVQPAQKC